MPSKKKKYNSRFPPARIKKIMQTDEDIGKVAAAVPVLISKCLEMFLVSLLSQAGDVTKGRKAKTMSTSHIKQCILEEQKFDFLKELVESIPDVQNEEEAAMYNEEETKKPLRKRSLPRMKVKETKKRARLGESSSNNASNEETESEDESDGGREGSEDNQQSSSMSSVSFNSSPNQASSSRSGEKERASSSMQFRIPIENNVPQSSEMGLIKQAESNHNHLPQPVKLQPPEGNNELDPTRKSLNLAINSIVQPDDGKHKIEPVTDVKQFTSPDHKGSTSSQLPGAQARQGVIVANTGLSNFKSPKESSSPNHSTNSESTPERHLSSNESPSHKSHPPTPSKYTPLTVPVHLSPQIPNATAHNPPVVPPGGMLSFLYSGGLAAPPPPLPQSKLPPNTTHPYMYNPLTHSAGNSTPKSPSSSATGSPNRPPNQAPKETSQIPYPTTYQPFPHYTPPDPNQLHQFQAQRHYLGYPQTILTPSTHPHIVSVTPTHIGSPGSIKAKPSKEANKTDDDDDYDT